MEKSICFARVAFRMLKSKKVKYAPPSSPGPVEHVHGRPQYISKKGNPVTYWSWLTFVIGKSILSGIIFIVELVHAFHQN